MADKKITALSERLVPIIGEDLLLLVANVVPASAAANYKVQVKNFLSNTQIQLPATAASGFRIVANVVANSTAVQSAAELTLDTGNNVIGGTKSYGLIVNHAIANTAYARCQAPVAFVAFKDALGANTSEALATTFLFDVGVGGTANASANLTGANANVMLSSTADKVATHTLKFQYNGSTYYFLVSNTAPA